MKKTIIIPMVQFILDIDWMTTTEFCKTYHVPLPYFIGDTRTTADQFLQVDAIKHKMFVEYAKLLNKNITEEVLKENLGFEEKGNHEICIQLQKEKYSIIADQNGFWLESYDSVDGRRINKIEDLINLGLEYKN